MWIGVTTQKNGLGRLCLTAVFFLAWSLHKQRNKGNLDLVRYKDYPDAVVLAIALYLLTGGFFSTTYSATAIGSLALGLILFILLLWLRNSRIATAKLMLQALVLSLLCYGIATLFLGGSTLIQFTSMLGRDSSLTGRTDVWSALLPTALQKPILGRGIGGFWNETTRAMYQISEGHSGYLDLLLEFGLVGLLFFSLFLLSSGKRAAEGLAHDFYWNSFWICYLVIVIVHNTTETSLSSLTSQMNATLVFMAISSSRFYQGQISTDSHVITNGSILDSR
jgi:O-antigen ligase